MKKLRLKKWVKITLTIIFITTLFITLKKLDNDFMESCQAQGYSYNYCMANK